MSNGIKIIFGLIAFLGIVLLSIFPNMIEGILFAVLGVVGAIFANSTGAGGGVVFVPMFRYLEMSSIQAVSTSFAIQAFGMTTGSVLWLNAYKNMDAKLKSFEWNSFPLIVIISTAFSISGIWLNYSFNWSLPTDLNRMFSVFSVCFGSAILLIMLLSGSSKPRGNLQAWDIFMLPTLALVGGVFTAWLSVAVGEIIAIYLILRGFNVVMSIASAVIISAITVWSAMPYQLLYGEIDLNIISTAGPGALVGAVVAKYIVGLVSTRKLKIYFGAFLLLTGLVTFY